MVSSGSGFARYASILFMDSMVVLECKPLSQLPWSEIDPQGPILLLAVPQALKEIDKHKRTGRLAKRARAFNRMIVPVALTGAPVTLLDTPVRVDLGVADCARIPWDDLHQLDPDEGDSRVVAEVLHALDVADAMKVVFSQDGNTLRKATRCGLKALPVPDHWLLDPEPGPHEKEVQRLNARLRDLEAKEPVLQIRLQFGVDAPLKLYRVAPLRADEQAALIRRTLRLNPSQAKPYDRFTEILDHDADYPLRYERYREFVVPDHALTFHKQLESHFAQIPFEFAIENVGPIQAENLVVTLESNGGTIDRRFLVHPLTRQGPAAPAIRSQFQRIGSNLPDLSHLTLPQAGRHDIVFAQEPNGDDYAEIHCQDFRRGKPWSFSGVATVNLACSSPFMIAVRITASNLHGELSENISLAFEVEAVEAGDLMDLKDCSLKRDAPMQSVVKNWLEEEDFGERVRFADLERNAAM